MNRGRFTVAGGGPVGSLLAILLARHGYRVGLYEGRADSRLTEVYQGKSINIALSDRGWRSLEQIGIGSDAKADAIPMYHRAVHGVDGDLSALPYGKDDDAIWSVSRGGINEMLLDIADTEPNIETHFEHRLVDVDFEAASAVFRVRTDREKTVKADYLLGADGAHSRVRRLAHGLPGFSSSETCMPQCYIELHMPASPDGSHRLEKNALHIWPRKEFMLIALPNPDGTFTCTLFLGLSGKPSFESLQERSAVKAFFESNFADAMDCLEDPIDVFMQKAPAPLYLVQVFPWSFNCKVGLIGDAAHALVPFYGQGMNCGFEDCAELNRLIELHGHDWNAVFPAYEQARKPNADAIAELSRRNFVEMSDLSGDEMFRLRKKIEAKFSDRFPELWTPLYSMVTFSPDVPYSEALRIGDEQDRVMEKIMALPKIEDDWDKQYVMRKLFGLASKAFGQSKVTSRPQNYRELEDSIHTDLRGRMSYGEYLHLPAVLNAQHRLSDQHDEILFIVIHQAAELWLKLAGHEVVAAIQNIMDDDFRHAFKVIARVKLILTQLTQSWSILSTMTPVDYLKFRDSLGPASGFQSYSYRKLEFLLGNKNEKLIEVHRHDREVYDELTRLLHEPSLYDVVLRKLSEVGFAIDEGKLERDFSLPYEADDSVQAAWHAIYSDPEKHFEWYELAEKLVDIEDSFQLWRFKHMYTVQRIIGHRQGTGGSSGVPFLKKAIETSFFPELFAIRSEL